MSQTPLSNMKQGTWTKYTPLTLLSQRKLAKKHTPKRYYFLKSLFFQYGTVSIFPTHSKSSHISDAYFHFVGFLSGIFSPNRDDF
jgi:hypothetical protein